MGVRVPSYKAFQADFEKRRRRYDLFGFILFDDRPTHSAIREFCERNFEWLDSLAAGSKMVLYVPIAYEGSSVQNCSLRIAGEFGIKPRDLPAILFFSLEEGSVCAKHASYLKFAPRAFDDGAEGGQALIADVFSAVSEAREAAGNQELILKLRTRIQRINRQQRLRPIKTWAKEYGLRLANLPLDVVQSMAQAYGARLAG